VKTIVIAMCVIASAIAVPASSRAQPVDAPNIAGSETMPWNRGVALEVRARAREAFLEGNRLFQIPLFSRAVEKYREALDQWKHPAFYFNLALAEINLGQYLEARNDLERAMQHGPEPLRGERYAEAKKQLVEVERHLGRIRVTCPTPGAEVSLDGVTLFSGPGEREIWVSPTAHEVTAKKPAYATQSRRLTLAAGAQERLSLSPRKLVEDRPWATWKPWAVVATGVVVAGAGGVVHALSARDFDAYDRGFGGLPCAAMGCTEQQIGSTLNSRLDRARLEQKIAIGGYVAGGAVLAAGVALVYMNRPHVMERDDTSPGGGIAVLPMISTDMLGVQVTVGR